MLTAMRYKNFVWPNNPSTFTAVCTRRLRSCRYPFSGFTVQELGSSGRVFKGEGEFSGPDAYDSFRRLAALFSEGGSGWLEHPVWQPVKVYFSKLELREAPGEEHIAYSFEFVEADSGTSLSGFTESAAQTGKIKYTQAVAGDTVASVASRYELQQSELLRLNPQLDAGDTLSAGQIIRIA